MSALKTRLERLESQTTVKLPRRVAQVTADHHHDDAAIHAALKQAGINLGWDGAIIMRVPGHNLSVELSGR